MTRQKLIPISFIAIALVAVAAITQSAYCQDEGYYSLMIQQSPVDAGFISPGVDIHQMPIGEHVTLKAIPKPGYRFVYWMGNVSDASASEAIVVMDGPKIVVAVFERSEHELTLEADDFPGGVVPGGGRGRLSAVRSGISAGGPVSASGPRITPRRRPPRESQQSDDFPVPGKENPIPEPTTVVLLGMGGLMLLRRKKR